MFYADTYAHAYAPCCRQLRRFSLLLFMPLRALLRALTLLPLFAALLRYCRQQRYYYIIAYGDTGAYIDGARLWRAWRYTAERAAALRLLQRRYAALPLSRAICLRYARCHD